MKKAMMILALAVLPLAGCATVAERLADALEPRLEKMVDAQIEREERRAGIWGTTNSYFHAEAERKAEEEARSKDAILAAVEELVLKNQDEILKRAEKLVEQRFK